MQTRPGAEVTHMNFYLLLAIIAALLLGLIWYRLNLERERQKAEEEEARRAAATAARLATERETAEAAARLAAKREAAEAAKIAARLAAEREAAEAARLAAEREAARLATEREAARLAAAEAAQFAAEREAAEAARLAAEREAAEAARREAEAARLAAEREAAEREAAEAARLAAIPPKVPKTPEQTVVMIADDSKVVRIKTGRLLSQNRYQVAMAEDGLDAAKQIENQLPDILITDVDMPGMDGFELSRHVRNTARSAHIPIIMITSHTGAAIADRAGGAGVNVLLGKPYPEEELIAQIQRLLN